MKIHPERSLAAVSQLARTIGKTATETALGIVAIANANMEKAIRVISVERGIDPRAFALLSFGGAGGMHAVEMAAHLGMPTVLVPRNAGVLSAFGLLMSDPVKDYTKSLMKTDRPGHAGAGSKRNSAPWKRRAAGTCSRTASPSRTSSWSARSTCRYLGQSYEIDVPYRKSRSLGQPSSSSSTAAISRLYSYRHDRRPVEIVNVRIKARGRHPEAPARPRTARRPGSIRRRSSKAEDPHRPDRAGGRGLRRVPASPREYRCMGRPSSSTPNRRPSCRPASKPASIPILNLVIRKAGRP
ncbi:MAG: hypothetical protein MZV70_66710 [Desulfobacterales bacterium]|nr:hypothetical protein [Desulfobacterales bacterium]